MEKKYKKEKDKWVLMADGEQWFEIFRTGTHTDSAGNTADWSEKDLDEIISLYDPSNHEAPIVIGHPEHDSPAYGWIEALKREGDRLLAKPKQLVKEFKNWIKEGIYKKVSIALYPDLSLRHVGFLGGMPPAVKGLKQAAFGDKKAKWIIESDNVFMQPWQQETVKSIFQRLRDWIIDKFGLEEADKVIGSWDIDSLKSEPANSGPAAVPAFTEKTKKGGNEMDLKKFFSDLSALVHGAQKELVPDSDGAKFSEADVAAAEKHGKDLAFAEMKTKLDIEAAEKKAAQDKLKEIETEKRKDEIASFCEGLCKEGKLTPALRKIIEPVMNFVGNPTQPPLNLRGGEEGLIEFAEGVKKSALDGIKDFLTELPKVITFREVMPPEGPGAGGSAGEKMSKLVEAKQKANKDLSFSAAFAEVSKENPELAKEYQAEVRPKQK